MRGNSSTHTLDMGALEDLYESTILVGLPEIHTVREFKRLLREAVRVGRTREETIP